MFGDNDRGAGGLLFSVAYLLGMLLLFIGERLTFDSSTTRLGLAAVAGALFVFAVGGRFRRLGSIAEAARPIEKRLLLLYVVGLGALLLYAAQADFMMEKLRPLFADPRSAARYAGALSALWIVVWLCSVLPVVFIELSYAPMDTSRTVELPRIDRSLHSALVVAMTFALVFALNFVVSEHNTKVDLSYFKTTRPSDSSKQMVKNLSEKLSVTLFFPTTNEVLEQLQSYFTELKSASAQLEIKVVDQLIEPKLAKKLSVSSNGAVVFARGKRNHQLVIGETLRRAKTRLRKLDSEFQNAFLRLARAQKVAYLMVGHEELTRDARDKVRGQSIRDLRTALTKLNYSIKDLGLAQGSASEIPKDASVVIIAGPRKPLLEGEVSALHAYLKNGGRAFIFLDPEAELPMAELLGPYGLAFTPQVLANERFHYRLTHTPADRHILISNRYGAHPSVRSLSRYSNQLGTVLTSAGYLKEMPPTKGGHPRVVFTLHAMPFTWNDVNGNGLFEPPAEQRKGYELAAAVTLKLGAKAGDKKADKKKVKLRAKDADEARLIVIADSGVISDKTFRNAGNQLLFTDAIKWLGGEEDFIGATTSEEDVRMVHTRKEDQLWFYLTIFAMPALVLLGGVFYTRRRRKRS